MNKEKQLQLIKSLADEIRPLVKKIEKSPKTTQDHYGRYGSILTRIAGTDRKLATVYGLAFKEAGANSRGIDAAINTFFN
jgi:hypothetical protein